MCCAHSANSLLQRTDFTATESYSYAFRFSTRAATAAYTSRLNGNRGAARFSRSLLPRQTAQQSHLCLPPSPTPTLFSAHCCTATVAGKKTEQLCSFRICQSLPIAVFRKRGKTASAPPSVFSKQLHRYFLLCSQGLAIPFLSSSFLQPSFSLLLFSLLYIVALF